MKGCVYFFVLTLVALALTGSAGASHPTRVVKHDRDVIRFFIRHPRLAHSPAGTQALWRIMGHLVIDLNRTLQSAHLFRPAHYQLWMCIHAGEGAWYDNTGNGYYNGLQMTWGWLGIIRGNPNNYTPLQIMQAAETGYARSGYSTAWLEGQWPNTSPPCLQYA